MRFVEIETYRGFTIRFDTDKKKFICEISESLDLGKESASYTAVKKFIDDYKKLNQKFEPFWVIPEPREHTYKTEKLQIVGVRKDGRFTVIGEDGKKRQLSVYDEDYYMIETDHDKPIIEEIKELEKRQREAYYNFKELKEKKISKLVGKNLRNIDRGEF